MQVSWGPSISKDKILIIILVYLLSAASAFASIGWKYYLIFIIVPAVAVPIILFLFPETKGLTLEEIGRLFGDETATNATQLSAQDDRSSASKSHTIEEVEKLGVGS
jgi:hypothetical protein